MPDVGSIGLSFARSPVPWAHHRGIRERQGSLFRAFALALVVPLAGCYEPAGYGVVAPVPVVGVGYGYGGYYGSPGWVGGYGYGGGYHGGHIRRY